MFSGSPIEWVVLYLPALIRGSSHVFLWVFVRNRSLCVLLLDILQHHVLFLDNDCFDGIWILCCVIHSLKSKCVLLLSYALCYYFDLEVASYVILHLVCIFGNEDCNF